MPTIESAATRRRRSGRGAASDVYRESSLDRALTRQRAAKRGEPPVTEVTLTDDEFGDSPPVATPPPARPDPRPALRPASRPEPRSASPSASPSAQRRVPTAPPERPAARTNATAELTTTFEGEHVAPSSPRARRDPPPGLSRLDNAIRGTGRQPRENRYAKSLGLRASPQRSGSTDESREAFRLNGDSGLYHLPKDRNVRPDAEFGTNRTASPGSRDAATRAKPAPITPESPATKDVAAPDVGAPLDADFATVAAAWPLLSSTTKGSIMSMVKGGKRRG